VVEQMLNAWQLSADLRLGMFAPMPVEPDPLAKEEHDVLRPRPPAHIDAHRLWIRYLQERLDIAKYKSALQLELFYHMMLKTLAFAGHRVDDSAINRHVSCVGLRYRYLR
jgi:phosphatidylinositol 4-kinase